VVPPAPTPPTPPDELMEAVRIELSRLEIPEELVNLDKGSARFRGHNLHLSPETSAAINKLLAQEVVRKLEEEQRRVIDSVQHTNVSQSPSRGRPNLPAMQGAKEPVGKKATKRSKKMLRVQAIKIMKREPDQTHDRDFLAKMLLACHNPASCCSATGRSLHALRKIGDKLSVDRINPRRGYVPGNVQLLALSINEEKQVHRRPPQSAINSVLRRLLHVTDDRLSPPTGMAQSQ